MPEKRSASRCLALDLHRAETAAVLCSFQLGDSPPAPRKTFRMHWELRCEHLWYRSFYLFSFGERCRQPDIVAVGFSAEVVTMPPAAPLAHWTLASVQSASREHARLPL